MAKVPEKKVITHTRHEYFQLECVAEGFFKVKNGVEDRTKLFTALFCRICGAPKEVLAATGLNPDLRGANSEEIISEEETVVLDKESGEETEEEDV